MVAASISARTPTIATTAPAGLATELVQTHNHASVSCNKGSLNASGEHHMFVFLICAIQ